MPENQSRSMDLGKLVFGLTLVSLGAMFLADQLGFFRADYLVDYWPVLLIALGVAKLLRPITDFGGVVVITLGILLLLDRLAYYDLRQTWPLLIVAAGLSIVLRSLRPAKRRSAEKENCHV